MKKPVRTVTVQGLHLAQMDTRKRVRLDVCSARKYTGSLFCVIAKTEQHRQNARYDERASPDSGFPARLPPEL